MNLADRPELAQRSRRVPARWRRLPRAARVVITAVLVLILVFAALTAQLLVWPAQGMPPRVSAIVMLSGPGVRLPVALQLAGEHRAPVLVVSQGHDGYGSPCPSRPSGVQLICFDPDPATTRGEAEYIGRLAKKYHWTSVVVVTSRPQATRARMLVERCFAGAVYSSTGPLPMRSWPYQIAYGWGALTKALLVDRTCLSAGPDSWANGPPAQHRPDSVVECFPVDGHQVGHRRDCLVDGGRVMCGGYHEGWRQNPPL